MSTAGLEILLAIREGLESVIDTDWVRPGLAPTEIGADVRLLVVGAEAGGAGGAWLRRLDFRSTATVAATFEIRTARWRWPARSARSTAALLRRREFRSIAAPTVFSAGRRKAHPTAQQLERARQWGEELGQELRPMIGPVRRHRITTAS